MNWAKVVGYIDKGMKQAETINKKQIGHFEVTYIVR
jgi:hypothetical protein